MTTDLIRSPATSSPRRSTRLRSTAATPSLAISSSISRASDFAWRGNSDRTNTREASMNELLAWRIVTADAAQFDETRDFYRRLLGREEDGGHAGSAHSTRPFGAWT